MPKTERPPAPARAPSALQRELAQRIARRIKDGSLAPGDHLTEQGLAALYDVSRTPVRVALQWLQAHGFVEQRANSGVFVAARAQRLKLDRLASDTPTEDELYRAVISDRAKGRLDASFTETELLARHPAPKGLLVRTLVRLARDGLIERRKGHGWSFAPALESRDALDDSYRFRMLVECGGLREPGFRIDAERLQRSRDEHQRFIEQPTRSRAPAAFFAMNARFHEMLAAFSGNRFIEQAVRQQNQLRRFEEYAAFVDRSVPLIESCRDHLQIMDALDGGDRERAAALLHRHLTAASRA